MPTIKALRLSHVCGLMLAIGAVAAALVAGTLQHKRQSARYADNFAEMTRDFTALITQRFHLYAYGLRGARGALLVAGPDQMTRLKFEEYYESCELQREFPGSLGIGYIARVPAARAEAFAETARADNFPSFTIRELAPNSGERFVIKYIYPLAGNDGATGLDIASEQNRRTAALAAARSGRPQLTAPITLVQAGGKAEHGFLFLLPVYRSGAMAESPDARETATIGWTYAPLVADQVLEKLDSRNDQLAFAITDTDAAIVFYASPGFSASAVQAGDIRTATDIDIFGHHWQITYHALPDFYRRYEIFHPRTLAAVIAGIGFLLAAGVFGVMRNRERKLEIDREETWFAQHTVGVDTAMREMRKILDAIPSMIAYWDRNQINRFSNKAYEHWFGITPDWLAGRHIRDLLGDELYEKNRPFIEAALRGETQRFERELTDRDGVKHATQAHYLPDITDGKVMGFYVLVFDVTELKTSELAQKAAREAAEEATRAKSTFLTSMSHELRTPMNSILGFADLLAGQFYGPLNDKQSEFTAIIKKSGEHLLKLIDEVLELSKIEAGRISLSIESVNVVASIRSAVAALQPLADKYRVTIKANNIGSDDTYVSADMTRLSQILINLGSNAIKYNRPGGWVSFSCERRPDDILRISVADNGRGIPKDRQAGAFQPFNRMGAEQGTVEGTGVGLALVKNLIEMMDARIGFESTEGEGSVFWIDMKIAPLENAEIEEAIISSANIEIPEVKAGTRILYIEDNENNRLLFRHLMAVIKDVEILEAVDGPSGLAVAKAQRPDIIFLDINLPGLSGFNVLDEIKSDPILQATPVIALTANAMAGDAERGLALGFHAYLTKPVRLDRILQIVKDLQQKKNPAAST